MLKPDGNVIPLFALATQASTFAGASALSSMFNCVDLSGWWAFAGVLFGAGIGLASGVVFGRLVFPASSGNAVVVRAGSAALPKTLFAALVPSLIVGAGIAVVTSLIVPGLGMGKALTWALGSSLAAGCIFGFGAALA